MAIDYAKLARTAQRLITGNGRDITITKKDRDVKNELEPWRPAKPTDTTIGPFKAVIIPFEEKDIEDGLVRRGDRRCLLSALDTTTNLIEEFDEIVDATEVWKIAGVNVLNPGATRILYDLTLRR